MTLFCVLVGLFCLGYYGFLWFFFRGTLAGDFLWLGLGGVLLLFAFLLRLAKEGALRLLLEGILILGMVVLAYFLGRIVQHMYRPAPAGLEVCVVLGAQVRGNNPSMSLQHRIHKAAAYAKDNPDTLFVLSGGQGDGENMTEARCMYENLLREGGEEDRLILEENSTSTRENLVFSDVLTGCAKKRTGVVTNSFHVCRALALAKKAGYEEVYGVSAPTPPYLLPTFLLREVACLIVEGLWAK
ncbi:MAG: YdcF family protein [Blautia sp.]|nr:YdcF family protein [Blautia sp.]